MKGVFIYDINRCVSCLACVAGCRLANNTMVPWRMVITDNPVGYPGLPVNNLSMACNHCENPACLEACPAKAYHVDILTGAVLLDEQKCLGCNYCYWCCPFDAPHYNTDLHNIQKCHFCYERIASGVEPACTSACPTGALSFDTTRQGEGSYGIIPDNDLLPRISFVKPRKKNTTDPTAPVNNQRSSKSKVLLSSEWSLVIFTYLSSLLFAFSFSELSGGLAPGVVLFIVLSAVCLVIPLVHLGHPFRAWRSILNLRQSPLSVEILFLVSFVIVANAAHLTGIRWLSVASFITGLLLMVAIDNVYNSADRRIVFRFHPGQIFLTGLLFASLFGLEIKALIFIAVVKLLLNSRVRYFNIKTRTNTVIATFYNLFLLSGILLLLTSGITGLTLILFLIAELINRIGYYLDFDPPGLEIEYLKRREYYENQKRD